MKILQTHPHLRNLGITKPNRIYWQLNTPQLYEEAVQRHEGYVAHLGPLVVRTGNQTSLAYTDRFIVAEPSTQGNISWGTVNRPFTEQRFDALLKRLTSYFNGLDVFVQDAYVRTATVDDKMSIRVITETAWHNLFVRNSYMHPTQGEMDTFLPEYTVLHAPGFRAIPERDGTHSDVFVILHLKRKLILIGGTSFAGEIQKAIFSVVHYLLPRLDVLTLECAANIGDDGQVVLFVGMDGSGKTTLATDDSRILLGDAEHGWNHDGVFSIGRGCYAHALGLTMDDSPDIWQTTRRFGTLLENVVVDVQTRRLELDNDSFTENTRISYPISHLLRATRAGSASHPRHIFLLVKDGAGVLPLISKLTPEQAQYYFLLGYTSELVTNKNGQTVAKPAFSACYGAPFMPLHAGHYAKLFADKIKRHNVTVWLLNTGWRGGDASIGKRISVETSRKVVRTILHGKLATVDYKPDSYFGLAIPTVFPGIDQHMLHPSPSWSSDSAYENAAKALINQFEQQFAQYKGEVNPEVTASQPTFS